MSAVIAIVGRPNVGKSALFNRIVGKRIAIVHDEPGVTRDRISAEAEWQGRPFTLIDTGGIGVARGEKELDVLSKAALNQVQVAIESAHLIFLVVNVQEGLVALDEEVARRLRACGKPVFLLANKVDDGSKENDIAEFARLGFEQMYAVSAIHGRGIPGLLSAAIKQLPAPETLEAAAPAADAEEHPEAASLKGPLKLAIVGRPNVGKSSLTNALSQSQRVIVSPIPGTTRDAVDVPFEVETDGVREKYVLIDTAGLRKRKHRDNAIEWYSVTRAEESIKRCDIVLFVLDAQDGIIEQDKKIADLIVQAKKACIVVINKWDLAAPEVAKAQAEAAKRSHVRPEHGTPHKLTTLAEFAGWVQDRLFFLDYAPVIFASAKDGINMDRLLEAVRFVSAQLRQKIPTAVLNRVFKDAIEARQPVSAQGHFLKLFYATQVEMAPPTFLLFVNRNELFSPAYYKYLADRMRQAFGYEGCPIVLNPRARPKTVESVRRKNPPKDAKSDKGRRKS